MTGHANLINLIADAPGTYTGQSAEINGAGFADMKFAVHAGSSADFDSWSKEVRRSTSSLSDLEYSRLLQPSENNKTAFYTAVEPGLYDRVLTKYGASHQHNTELQ
jgi:cytochrome o ubiquinol oxidase subunit 2